MARPIRIERPGAWYHITARGNDRQRIFTKDAERRHFCALRGQMVGQFNLWSHAYVLMDNHYHLLVELREGNLSRALQWLNASYSVWFNRRQRRCGHLFQGRYKAVILDPQEWALGLSRYIHLNPVRTDQLGLSKREQQRIRAGASEAPQPALIRERIGQLRRYRWSSYRAYIALDKAPPWLEQQAVLRMGGAASKSSRGTIVTRWKERCGKASSKAHGKSCGKV